VKVLISVVSLDEARLVADASVDVIDVKNPMEGSLGAQTPWVIREIAEHARSRGIAVSATLGDLPALPGTAALAAFGAAQFEVDYIKVGLHGTKTFDKAAQLLAAIRCSVRLANCSAAIVAAGYADFRRFGGLVPADLVRAAAVTECDVVMLDTADKQAGNLFDAMPVGELESFVQSARRVGLLVALAGSIQTEHLPALRRLAPDIIGVRGAVCVKNDRTSIIDIAAVRRFIEIARTKSGHETPIAAVSQP